MRPSRRRPGPPRANRYVFRAAHGPDGASRRPTGESFFGGPAWEPIGDGDWYLHLFAPEQPDLNWANHEVREDFLTTLRFWSDRGVDGFRIDVAHLLAKDLGRGGAPPTCPRRSGSRRASRTARTRSRTATRSTRSTGLARGVRRVRPAADGRRRGLGAAAPPRPLRRPEGLGQAFNFDLLQRRGTRRRSARHHQNLAAAARGRRLVDVGVLEPRHGPPRHPLRPAQRRPTSSAWLLRGRHDPQPDLERGPAPGPGRDAAGARAARARPTCTRARSWACPRWPTSRATRCRTRRSSGRRAPRRAATAAGSRCPGPRRAVVRLRPRSRLPSAPAGLVRRLRRRAGAERAGVDAALLHRRARRSPLPAGRRGAVVAHLDRRRGRVRAARRVGVGDELR